LSYNEANIIEKGLENRVENSQEEISVKGNAMKGNDFKEDVNTES